MHNSRAHASIGTPSPSKGAPTACKSVVSGSFHSPIRGSFHLSLTVLVLYRSLMIFSLGAWSPQIPTKFPGFRGTQDTFSPIQNFNYRTVTFFGPASQLIRLSFTVAQQGPTTPTRIRIGLGSSPFARRYSGNLFRFLFLRLLRCFNSPGTPPHRG